MFSTVRSAITFVFLRSSFRLDKVAVWPDKFKNVKDTAVDVLHE